MNNYRYIRQAIRKMKKIRPRFLDGELDEQALPSYLDGNVMSRLVFISRLLIAMSMVDICGQKQQCTDFGCGSGILLPWLAERFENVNGIDLDLRFAQFFCPETENIRLAESLASADIAPQSQNLILALDVLEHMDDPSETIRILASLLHSEGIMIISGPTENWLYRLGRRIVGFDGHYHRTNIYAIGESASNVLRMYRKARILPIFTLFEILCLEHDYPAGRIFGIHPQKSAKLITHPKIKAG
jgi:2-polyprenyl-3-methyl-5-hydroxy-6-metoxy-1,4-benzoquinol methylase